MPSGSQITIPPTPVAPSSIDFTTSYAVAISLSPFSNAQQIYDWNSSLMECSVAWPAMSPATAGAWITFLQALKGPVNYFAFTSAFTAEYAASLGSRFWRLKTNTVKWTVMPNRYYSISFEIREAK